MAPQPINRIAMAVTRNLLLSAKSTRARIICCSLCTCGRGGSISAARRSGLQSLSEHVVQDQSVRNHLLARFQPRLDLLHVHVVLQEVATDHFHAANLVVRRWNEDPIAIMHVHHGGRRDNGVHLPALTVESGPYKHAEAHHSRSEKIRSEERR